MEISYKVIYSKNRKRSLLIKIDDSGDVLVYVPHRTKQSAIDKFIDSKRSWILKKSMLVKKRNENRFCFISEKKFLYLGNEYELVVSPSKLLTSGGFCEFDGVNKLIINLPEKNAQKNDFVLKLIRDWYIEKSNNILAKKTEHYAKLHGFPIESVSAKEQKTMWGCCDSKNNIRYNWRIIMANEKLIDYLVVHELSHTIHKNHSKDFWNLVESILPEHKSLRKELKSMNYLLKMEFK
jgi:predicted metal-dependent hydrolase